MEPTERRSRAGEEAAEWWLRLQTEELSREQREAFVDWLRESAVHVAEMLRVASVHGALEQFEHWTRIATSSVEEQATVVPLPVSRGQPASPPGGSTRRLWLAAAAVACIGLVAALLLPNLTGQVIHTERGERREVVLADGSVVQVDPESRLRVKLEDRSRRVFLETGRALFRVAKDANRPFLVQADATTVRAVGTAFGVERRSQGVIVTVAEGKVAVEGSDMVRRTRSLPDGPVVDSNSHSTHAAGEAFGGDRSDASIVLTANEQVTLPAASPVAEIRKVDSTRALAWAEGRLIFESTPVAEVVAQFNRYNSIQLRVEDEQLARRPISGVFNAANPESFIDFMQAATSVQVDRQRAGEIVIATGR